MPRLPLFKMSLSSLHIYGLLTLHVRNGIGIKVIIVFCRKFMNKNYTILLYPYKVFIRHLLHDSVQPLRVEK